MHVFETLTDEQRAAVGSSASTYVDAGPGSGKTRVIAARIAYLIESGENPADILALTFTRSAAANIKHMVERWVGERANAVRVMTFHGYAASIVVPDGMRVATEAESEAALRSLYRGPTKRNDAPCITEVRREIMRMESTGHRRSRFTSILESRMQQAGIMPTWSLLPKLLDRTLDGMPQGVMLVDEAQDMTSSEILVVESATFLVGDPRQAIMEWRGGLGENVGLAENVARLTRTFRFGPTIAQAANIIAEGFGGAPIVGADLADYVLPLTARGVGEFDRQDASVAWLCRTHHDCEIVTRKLADHGIAAEHVKRRQDDPKAALDQDADRIGDVIAAQKVAVCTVHAAKGREFDVVAVDQSVFDSCDSSRSERAVTDEDHRVLYVAATRARSRLLVPLECLERMS